MDQFQLRDFLDLYHEAAACYDIGITPPRLVYKNSGFTAVLADLFHRNDAARSYLCQPLPSQADAGLSHYTSNTVDEANQKQYVITWNLTPLNKGDTHLRILIGRVLETIVPPRQQEASSPLCSTLPVRSAIPWISLWDQQTVPGKSQETISAHNDLVKDVAWEQTELGPIHNWSPILLSVMGIALSSPSPVLIAWGKSHRLLYNDPYARTIARKHPRILGMGYQEAWSEVWDLIKEPVAAAMDGRGTHCDHAQMFLYRDNVLEETYFTWSMIPIRGLDGSIEGIYIPNFDNTMMIIADRRMSTLRDINTQIANATTSEGVWHAAMAGMSSNPLDIPFAILYTCQSIDNDDWLSDGGLSSNGRNDCSTHSSTGRRGYSYRQAESITFHLSQSINCRTDHPGLPQQIHYVPPARASAANTSTSSASILSAGHHPAVQTTDHHPGASLHRPASVASNMSTSSSPPPHRRAASHISPSVEDHGALHENEEPLRTLADHVKMVWRTNKPVFISKECMEAQQDAFLPGVWNDRYERAICLPINLAHDDMHGVLIMGLNTRRVYDANYRGFVDLMMNTITNGLAGVMLHQEEMRRAQYLAEVNRQKNEELQEMLNLRTKELRHRELQFMQITEQSPSAIFLADKTGHIFYVNKSWCILTSQPATADPNAWGSTVVPEDLDNVNDFLQRARGGFQTMEFRLIARNEMDEEVERWVEATCGPMKDDTGTLALMTGTMIDISQRKKEDMHQRQRAEEAIELKRQQEYFIDMTSHELRNPLSAICLAVESVVDKLSPSSGRPPSDTITLAKEELAEAIEDVNTITLCTMHMKRLIDDILSLSKLESDLLVVTPVRCQPLRFMKEILKMFSVEMESKDIACTMQILEGYRLLNIDWVRVDPSRITQVLINLLTNAIKFTSTSQVRKIDITVDASLRKPDLQSDAFQHHPLEGASRESAIKDEDAVMASRSGSPVSRPSSPSLKKTLSSAPSMRSRTSSDTVVYLMFTVKDSGRGLEESERKLLFQRFKQATPRTHVQYGGSGLGLFISRKLTHLLGGEIVVDSIAGQGSTFTFYVRAETCLPPRGSNASQHLLPGHDVDSSPQDGPAPSPGTGNARPYFSPTNAFPAAATAAVSTPTLLHQNGRVSSPTTVPSHFAPASFHLLPQQAATSSPLLLAAAGLPASLPSHLTTALPTAGAAATGASYDRLMHHMNLQRRTSGSPPSLSTSPSTATTASSLNDMGPQSQREEGHLSPVPQKPIGAPSVLVSSAPVPIPAFRSAVPDASVLMAPMPSKKRRPEALHVLLTEDNLINQHLLQRQLQKAGCTVHVANNGQEALEQLARSTFCAHSTDRLHLDVVLLDIEMPVMDGMTCIQLIRQHEQEGTYIDHVPVVAVSANARPEQIQRMLDAGMDDTIAKPFQIKDILVKMRQLVDRFSTSQSSTPTAHLSPSMS